MNITTSLNNFPFFLAICKNLQLSSVMGLNGILDGTAIALEACFRSFILSP